MDHSPDDHPHGLEQDLQRLAQLASRRRSLQWLAGAAALPLGGLALAQRRPGGAAPTPPSSGGSSGSSGSSSCPLTAAETAGPYPGDGSNSNGSGIANALLLTGILRSDIRSSFAGASGAAQGVPLTVKLKLVNTSASCASLAGYAIYLWHCDREGRYSMYSSGVTAENYLRGVQVTGSDGTASFTTIFPGCYSGRMPHMHFEVVRSATTATQFSTSLRTSQIALPTAVCSTVYSGASGYSASVSNFARISFATDNVFSDGTSTEMSTVTGGLADGYAATLQVAISV